MGIKKRIRAAWRAFMDKPKDRIEFGVDVRRCSECARKLRVLHCFKMVHDPDDFALTYLETDDGLRLIFRDGKYTGWYTPTLPDALN